MLLHPLHWAQEQSSKPAIVLPDTGCTTSYGELALQICRGAHFIKHLGLSCGDGLVLLAENSADFLGVYWAAQVSGLYFTPISTQFQSSEIEYLLNNCDASMLVVSRIQRKKLAGINVPQKHQLNLEDWQQTILSHHPGTGYALSDLPASACEGAEMLYSSGSTGHPKGIRNALPGAELGEVAQVMTRRLKLHKITQDTVYLSPAPLYHSAPLRYNQMVLRSGGTSVIMRKFDAETALALIDEHKITHSQWVPTMLIRLLKLPEQIRSQYSLNSLKFAIHAAAPCPVQIKHRMIDWWGPILYEYYGGTEGNGQTAIDTEQWLNHPGSVGKAITGTIHIQAIPGPGLEDSGACHKEKPDLAPGESGLVFFEGGGDFTYYKDDKSTQTSRTESGWSTLGDIGYLDDEGYLYLTDRLSFMIISGGVNIYPREIEDVLLSHPLVLDVAVFGIPHAEFGEEVKAAIQLNDDLLQQSDAAYLASLELELMEYCRSKLAHLKCPRSIDFHQQLPRHQTGKIYKQPLRAAYQ